MKIEMRDERNITLAPRDGAFVFCHGKGVDVHMPLVTSATPPASEEALTAMVMAWALRTPTVMHLLFDLFGREVAGFVGPAR